MGLEFMERSAPGDLWSLEFARGARETGDLLWSEEHLVDAATSVNDVLARDEYVIAVWAEGNYFSNGS